MDRRNLSRPRLGLALFLALVIPVLSACGTTSTSPSAAASAPPAASQPATSAAPCGTVRGSRRRHVHRRMGRPVLQRQRLDHPDGPGRRRPLVRQDLRPPDDVRSPRRGQAGRRLRCELRRLRQAHRRSRRVVGDLRRPADLDVQPSPGRDLARRRAVHREGRQVHDRAVLQREEHACAPCAYVAAVDGVVGVNGVQGRHRDRGHRRQGRRRQHDHASTFINPNSLFPTSISELFILPEHALGKTSRSRA